MEKLLHFYKIDTITLFFHCVGIRPRDKLVMEIYFSSEYRGATL